MKILTISYNFKKYRADAGMTQTELAEKLGVKQQTISALENNNTPIFEQLVKICRALNCTPNDILGFTDEENSEEIEENGQNET